MENKIQEIADKIYLEGVEKGNKQAENIVKEAERKATEIIENAKKEAEAIVSNANKTSKELEENTKTELKLYADQSVSALKTEITNLISNELVNSSVKDFIGNKEFLNKFIVNLASKWSAEEEIVISSKETEELKAYFLSNAKELLDSGKVRIEEVNGIKTLFSVSPASGAYKVNFGEEEFVNYLKAFLRPKLVEVLF